MSVERTLLKNGCVLTLDSDIGNFRQADVLIEGAKIAAVGPNLSAADAQVIDASDRIVMPGFVDTHRHIWEGILRNIAPDALLDEYFDKYSGRPRAGVSPRGRLRREPGQRAGRYRFRRHHAARLVSYPEHAGAWRRRHRRAARIRFAVRLRVRQSEPRQGGVVAQQQPQTPARHQAHRQSSTSLRAISSSRWRWPRAARNSPRSKWRSTTGSSRAKWVSASVCTSASPRPASTASWPKWAAPGCSGPTPPTFTAAR